MRDLLARESTVDVSRLTDDQVIDEIAGLLLSDRLHIHSRPREVDLTKLKLLVASEASVPFPIVERKKPATASKETASAPDPATFDANTNFAAQAATLIAASKSGAPACYI